MSFSFFKKEPFLSFVFDIRDASVSIAVVKFEKIRKPEMILCQRFEVKNRNQKDYEKYLSSMINALDKAIVSVKKTLMKMGDIEGVCEYYFFIGSPWSVSQSKIIKISKDKPFEINNSILEKILVGEEASISKSIEEQTHEPDWKVLEEKVIQSKLNGYKVENIFGKKASDLTVELFVSFIPVEVKNKLSFFMNQNAVNNIKKQSNSCILSSYTFFRDLYSNKNDFIYVDLGNLITDIYVVKDDVIFGVVSFPYGEESIIETSLSKTNLTKNIFLSHINIGQDKNFDLASHNNGADLLKFGFELWESKLKESLSKICNEMNIPNNIFIITNTIISGMLAKELSNKAKKKKLEILGTKIDTLVVTEGIINSFILNGSAFADEPYIKMDLVFLDKILKQQN